MAANSYITFVGTVVEIVNRYKAVMEFDHQGSKHRALLKVEKLTCKPNINPDCSDDHPIGDFIKYGTKLKCLCHKFDETKDHKCGWYVAEVEAVIEDLTDPSLITGLCPSMVNKIGWISHLDKRQGIISCKDEGNGLQQDVLLLASKLFIGGKRVNVKQPLDKFIEINEKISFDAVPIDPEENDHHCAWFATVAWKRSKPTVDYNVLPDETDQHLAQIEMIKRNPKSQFLRGKGQIMQILSESYGIALGAVNQQQTHWQSILFHRSCASLFKFNLGKVNLHQVFKEGDKIRFIAAPAPKNFSAQWVAAHISIDVVGDAHKLVQELV